MIEVGGPPRLQRDRDCGSGPVWPARIGDGDFERPLHCRRQSPLVLGHGLVTMSMLSTADTDRPHRRALQKPAPGREASNRVIRQVRHPAGLCT